MTSTLPEARAVERTRFGSLDIAYDSRVLRPRPWTTAQSGWAAVLLRCLPAGDVLELCSGAGQIGLLAVHRTDRRLVCVDIDPVATSYARQNAVAAGMGDRVEVRTGDMAEVLAPHERFAMVVADPPWVPRSETGRFPEDPVRAIDGGVDGMALVHTCLSVIDRHLATTGEALLQVGTVAQVKDVEARLAHHDLRIGGVRRFARGTLVRLVR